MYWIPIVVFLIPITVILAWGVHRAIKVSYEGKASIAQSNQEGEVKLVLALDENAAINRQVLAKLDGLEKRLTNVEKTLNDIPA